MTQQSIHRSVLAQADSAAPDPYRPGPAYADHARILVERGLLERCQLGAFVLPTEGQRELTRMRVK